ncbi:NmrA family NAD(P)-binding protein [Microdochium nivale]|nr:NmrA family NAD(P)-binding protein [Microdochium nivale]
MSRAILITGATGKQGGATLRALAASDPDAKLLAVTRNATSASAQALASRYPQQVSLVQGNLDDAEALFASAKKATSEPIWGVFSVQLPTFNKTGAETEERQGKALVDAAIRHGVRHFVYSSVDRHGPERSPRNPTDVPHFITKHNIEQHLMSKTASAASLSSSPEAMTWTILRPVAFYDNLGGFQGKVFTTAWRNVLGRSKPLQLIGANDVGAVAARALLAENQSEFAGRAVSLAGDELTYDEFEAIYAAQTGSGGAPTTFGFMAGLVMWMVSELGSMYAWFAREGFAASVAESRRVLPGIKDFATWLADQRARKLL